MQELMKKLFAEYYRDVYIYLYSLSRDAQLAEDLASEVFLEMVKSIAGFRRESDVKTWLFTIARRRWFAYLRQKKRQVETEMLSEFLESPQKAVDDTCRDQEMAKRIYELLDAEPERTGNIVRMRLEGYSFYEIGARYGISENSARVIDFRAKTKIRNILKKEGIGDE